MENWGLWVIGTMPFYFAFTNRLKGQSQNIALWIYFWSLGAFWSAYLWHSYHLYLSYQQMDLDSLGVELANQHLHMLFLSVGILACFIALPPIWYLRDKRKSRVLTP